MSEVKTTKEVVRISGKLKELITIKDEAGNVLHKVISPLKVEFYPQDIVQVIVGAALLAIPVAFTEETWKLGQSLPMNNVIALLGLSIIFMATFVYYNSYRDRLKDHFFEYLKRVISTYVIATLVVALILNLIQVTPWDADPILALKRVIIVSFPASMSAAVADMIK